ncbi:hypothetical protein DACRYDRAFT_23272 [Dacryopinax primogenitus]|uniref:Uncharacterized protein n=1 Tax=Dacryopinax primogenitus (strain DJM 731) TaxID=1858805 RepID=M5FVM4_DACPD|nr:uncharacterized protein DACRYDRAFT_23272 [Dacryopinax primogenitus]EJU00369.1 hypothetical protein DACRYDRAFT_23272 [Dacryopinax primogenitus]
MWSTDALNDAPPGHTGHGRDMHIEEDHHEGVVVIYIWTWHDILPWKIHWDSTQSHVFLLDLLARQNRMLLSHYEHGNVRFWKYVSHERSWELTTPQVEHRLWSGCLLLFNCTLVGSSRTPDWADFFSTLLTVHDVSSGAGRLQNSEQRRGRENMSILRPVQPTGPLMTAVASVVIQRVHANSQEEEANREDDVIDLTSD